MPSGSETAWLWLGLIAYAGAAAASCHAVMNDRVPRALLLSPFAIGVLLLSVAIAVRWRHVGYGPFLTLFEVLLSNIFSLGLICLVVYGWDARTRIGGIVTLPVLLILGMWSLSVPADPGRLPATFDNMWLWFHVGFGKLFLGTCLVAVGLSGVLLLNRAGCIKVDLYGGARILDSLVWRLLAVAFVFHSLMLIAGAVWAQDAWGRYWAWDPLETWALITWLLIGMTLHVRLTWNPPDWVGWSLVILVFLVSVMTFLGVPFLSSAPHKGLL